MRKNETPEILLWEEMAKTFFSKGRDDIDLSYLNVGDILHLTDIAIHTLPDGDKCCVCKSEDGHIIPPAILLRSGNGIKFTTKDFKEAAWELFDMIMSAYGLALIVEKNMAQGLLKGEKDIISVLAVHGR